jgi:glycosyltransferase involved in cell wall biosynthesis
MINFGGNISNIAEQFDGICCFGGEDWWYHNRGHIDMQLMRKFACQTKVLYINSVVMQRPKLKQGKKFAAKAARKIKSILRGLRKQGDNFWVYSPVAMPVHHIRWAAHLNGIILNAQVSGVLNLLGIKKPLLWVACPTACQTSLKMKRVKLVYQRTDRYEEFPNVDADIIKKYDYILKAAADLTVFVNHNLLEEERNQCRKTLFLDHGVDFSKFACAERSEQKPEDIKNIKRPLAGFYGGIDEHTSDIKFIEKVIDLLPRINFVFVGNASADISGLILKKNVHMLGQKPYELIPHYGKCFDVAFMPWRQGRWIEACNPVKLKEYLALGKPVVTTPFPELEYYNDVIYEAATPEEFAICIEKALAEDGPQRIIERRKKVETATWESKTQLALKTLFDDNGMQ